MKTRCKCCLSPQLDYINEMLEQGLSFSTITARMKDVYNQVISKDSLANHKKHHMGKEGSEIDTAKDKPNLGKGDLPKMLNPPVSKLAALTRRIHVLELILARYLMLDGSHTSYVGYDLNGSHPHEVKRRDLLTSEMGDAETIEAGFNALVTDVIKKQREASGESATDDFKEEREELRQKHSEDAKRELAKAEAEIAKQEAEVAKINANKNLSPERILEKKRNDEEAAKWYAKNEAKKLKEAKEEVEAIAADQAAVREEIENQAAIMEMEDEGE